MLQVGVLFISSFGVFSFVEKLTGAEVYFRGIK